MDVFSCVAVLVAIGLIAFILETVDPSVRVYEPKDEEAFEINGDPVAEGTGKTTYDGKGTTMVFGPSSTTIGVRRKVNLFSENGVTIEGTPSIRDDIYVKKDSDGKFIFYTKENTGGKEISD